MGNLKSIGCVVFFHQEGSKGDDYLATNNFMCTKLLADPDFRKSNHELMELLKKMTRIG